MYILYIFFIKNYRKILQYVMYVSANLYHLINKITFEYNYYKYVYNYYK